MHDYANKGTSYGPDMNMGTRPSTFPDKMEDESLRKHMPKREPELKRIVDRLDYINGSMEKTLMQIDDKLLQLHRFEEEKGAKPLQDAEVASTVTSVINTKLDSLYLKSQRLDRIYNQLCEVF